MLRIFLGRRFGLGSIAALSGSSFPTPLSEEEEALCLEKMQNGDEDARNKLIEHNLRLVAHIVKKYSDSNDPDDLISIGTIGLIKGITSFNSSKNTKLATYAARCIENSILTQWLLSKQKWVNMIPFMVKR